MKTFTRSVLAWACLLLAALSAHAGKVTHFHNDVAGSPLAATNESGQVVWRESYRPYGERLTKSALSKDNDVWFTSRRQDATGLVYMGARYYDPVAGRFVSMDPKGFDEANVLSFGRYTYGNDNPYKYKDPDGKWAIFANESDGRDVRAEVQNDSTRAVFAGARDAIAEFADRYFTASILGLGSIEGYGAQALATREAAGTMALYRAVSTAEHADIVATGALRPGPNSIESGKWFAESATHARQWGTALEGAGKFNVIEATFPRSVADQFLRNPLLDNIGPARFGTFEQMGKPGIATLGP